MKKIKKLFIGLIAATLLMIPAVIPASALSCNAGWHQTSNTKTFQTAMHTNVTGETFYSNYRMVAVGCYNGLPGVLGMTEGLSLTITWSSDTPLPTQGQGFYKMTDGTHRTDFWNNRGPWNTTYVSLQNTYFRLKLGSTGVWSTSGTGYFGCSYGFAGGWCSTQ